MNNQQDLSENDRQQPSRAEAPTIIYKASAASTNDDAFALLVQHESCLVWTLDQNAGRGSRGRSWLTPPGKGLAISIGVHAEAAFFPGTFCYPLFAAVLLHDCLLRQWPSSAFQLKWPNDILLNGRKVAGILCESRLGKPPARVVMGFGINLYDHPALAELPKPTAVLAECGGDIEPRRLVEDLARHLRSTMRRYTDTTLLRDDWLARCAFTLGARLRLHAGGETLEGSFAGLDEAGALMLRSFDGSMKVVHQTCEDFAILSSSG